MNIKLLTEQHLGFLSLKGGCTDSPECIHIKMLHCLEISCHEPFEIANLVALSLFMRVKK